MTIARKLGIVLSLPILGASMLVSVPAASATIWNDDRTPYCSSSVGCYETGDGPAHAPTPVYNDPHLDDYNAAGQECAADLGTDLIGGAPVKVLKGGARMLSLSKTSLDVGRSLYGSCAEAYSIKETYGPFEVEYYTPSTSW